MLWILTNPAVTYATAQHQGCLFWITCKRIKLMRKVGHLQLIQNSVPSVAGWHQCCIRMIQPHNTTTLCTCTSRKYFYPLIFILTDNNVKFLQSLINWSDKISKKLYQSGKFKELQIQLTRLGRRKYLMRIRHLYEMNHRFKS